MDKMQVLELLADGIVSATERQEEAIAKADFPAAAWYDGKITGLNDTLNSVLWNEAWDTDPRIVDRDEWFTEQREKLIHEAKARRKEWKQIDVDPLAEDMKQAYRQVRQGFITV